MSYGVKEGAEVWYNGKGYLHTPAVVTRVLPDGKTLLTTPDGKQHQVPKVESSMEVDSKSQAGVPDILQVLA